MSGDSLTVHGGVGGATVNLADLADLGRVLRDVAHVLGEARAALAGAEAGLVPALALSVAGADAAAVALQQAGFLAARCEEEAARLAGQVAAARAGYEEAESVAMARLADVFLPAGPGDFFARLANPWRLPRLETHQALIPLGWALAGSPTSRPVVKVAVVGGPAGRREPVTGVGFLLEAIDRLYPGNGGQPGTVEVRRVEHAGGERSWVVLIPGTQSLAPGGRNPMDDATNLQEFVGAPSAVATGVLAALSAAGARRDEPVLLAGHSQGGIVATRLAADAGVRRRFRVTSVLTAGSPVGHVPVPSDVGALHLEHVRDLVPTLDDAPNPDEAGRVTVRHDGGTGSIASAHEAAAYARTGALVDSSSHPSLRAWREQAGEVLGGESAKTTGTVYALTRT